MTRIRALAVGASLCLVAAPAQADALGLTTGGGIALYGERARRWGSAEDVPGLRLTLGEHFATRTAPLAITGWTGASLRWLGGDQLSFSREEAASGVVRAGPVGLGVFAGTMLLTIDHLAGQWSVGLLSPQSGVFVEARVARGLYVAARVELEYQWRWLGDDYRVLSLGIALYSEPSPRARSSLTF